ncbi:MAG: hypothetical protein ACLFR0_08500 [Alphaproteobacteria bacterium]
MEPEKMPEEDKTQEKSTGLALIALAASIICFTFSAITPWAMDVFAPVPEEYRNSALDVDFWSTILQTGFAPSEATPHSKLHSIWTLLVMLGSIFTLSMGVTAFIRRENTRMSALAMAFAFMAIFMQYMMVFAGVILILLMLYLVLASFGVT